MPLQGTGCCRVLAGVDRTSCSYIGDSFYSSTIISSLMFSLFSVFVFSLNDFAPSMCMGFRISFVYLVALHQHSILCRIWQMLYVHLNESDHGCLWLLKLRTTAIHFQHLHRVSSRVFEEHLIEFCFSDFFGRSDLTFFLPTSQVRVSRF